ncbi:MAG: Asp-tRNA(Asn)/Glu-tRNA(Gln) amidotransferase subunit GatC [Desulfobacterales bacterium]|jgi:aspartyl-tRNA(Asn)/glutamyl-tRNA(Gln) amidotransferase subunit C|nr:Asp-tRNA(Asn)/Glu-tRNA(Gln) amidotransferase subunit GatC [Desulfobacterales bacterium]
MKITKQEVLHVAHLARLNMDESMVDLFSVQLGKVLEYVETLNQLDSAGVTPTSHAIDMSNAFREDAITSSIDRQAALSNAPEEDAGSFIVPKVIE